MRARVTIKYLLSVDGRKLNLNKSTLKWVLAKIQIVGLTHSALWEDACDETEAKLAEIWKCLKADFIFWCVQLCELTNCCSLFHSAAVESYSLLVPTKMADSHVIHVIGITLSGLTIIGTSPLFLGVILFERFGSDKKRTLINLLVSSICWRFITWNLLVQLVTVFHFICGSFSGKSVIYFPMKTNCIGSAFRTEIN